MANRRIAKPGDIGPEQKAREKELREKFQAERPTLKQLTTSGDYDPPVKLGRVFEVLDLIAELRRERLRQGLSLAEVARRAGMPAAALSRLEAGRRPNPTITTITTYAAAVGKNVAFAVQDAPD